MLYLAVPLNFSKSFLFEKSLFNILIFVCLFFKKIRAGFDVTEKGSSDTLWHIFIKVKKGCAQKPGAFVA